DLGARQQRAGCLDAGLCSFLRITPVAVILDGAPHVLLALRPCYGLHERCIREYLAQAVEVLPFRCALRLGHLGLDAPADHADKLVAFRNASGRRLLRAGLRLAALRSSAGVTRSAGTTARDCAGDDERNDRSLDPHVATPLAQLRFQGTIASAVTPA